MLHQAGWSPNISSLIKSRNFETLVNTEGKFVLHSIEDQDRTPMRWLIKLSSLFAVNTRGPPESPLQVLPWENRNGIIFYIFYYDLTIFFWEANITSRQCFIFELVFPFICAVHIIQGCSSKTLQLCWL